MPGNRLYSDQMEVRENQSTAHGDRRMFSDFKQSSHGLLQGFANLWWRIVRISDWGYIHLSKHQSSPFNLNAKQRRVTGKACRMVRPRSFTTLQQDAEALV